MVAEVETPMSAMVAVTDWKQLPFEFDEEKAEVRLEVVMIVEEEEYEEEAM